ncbi:hypothetical protein [Rhodoferax sp.]|jgi:hypothetical protein|uniref:hypothetical protein n=1 Tax=Rhodoferax sp. TaxID=50421 RepID=UPI0027348426|nr:hypothetical protein [Rhodoferax sp.]MDP3191462.1 hypothetical protein [Rhodoferax sp.]MDP3335325.1 hypothetical protein [Rhodoferax sp.]
MAFLACGEEMDCIDYVISHNAKGELRLHCIVDPWRAFMHEIYHFLQMRYVFWRTDGTAIASTNQPTA